MCEVSRVEDGFIVRITAPQENPTSWLWSKQHGDDWPGVTVGQRSVHLPQVVTDAMCLKHEVWSHGDGNCESLLSSPMCWVTSRHGTAEECSSSGKMSKVYKVPGGNNSSVWSKKIENDLIETKLNVSVYFIKDELRKTWLAQDSGQLKLEVATSIPWYSLFGSVFHRQMPDSRRRNGTRYLDGPDFCWWTWWTPRPGP